MRSLDAGGRRWNWGHVVALFCFVSVLVPAAVAAKERPAHRIVKQFDSVKYPGFINDISMEEYGKLVIPPSREQCELALELRRSHPRHKEVSRLMRARWTLLLNVFDGYDQVLAETEDELRGEGEKPLRNAALTSRAHAALMGHRRSVEERFGYVRAAVAANPKDDDFGPHLLTSLATDHIANPSKQRDLCQLAIDKFGIEKCDEARLHLRYLKKLGEIVPLEFQDALSGEMVRRDDSKPTIVFSWWASENAKPHVEALRQVEGVQVIFVHVAWGQSADRALAVAKQHNLPGPLLVESRLPRQRRPDTEKSPGSGSRSSPGTQPLRSLGVSDGGVYLLINKDGRLTAVTGHLEPLSKALNPQRSLER